MKARVAGLSISLVVSSLLGCWSFVRSPPEYQQPLERGGDREAVLLVSDAGIPFTDGSLGTEITKALASSKALGQVYYPVVPEDPPPLVIRVKAIGEYDESYVLGVISSSATGYFFFIPAPIMPYLQWYSATCQVVVLDGDAQLTAFEVESSTRFVFHALFADARSYRTKVKDSVLRDLANGVARKIAALQLRSPSAAVSPGG